MDKFTDAEFQKFCMAECERLGVFPQYRFITPVAKGEYCNWVYQKSDGDQQKVQRLIDEVTRQYDKLPTIRELGKIWFRLFPAVHERPSVICEVCHGTGYRIIEVHSVSCAKRCPQGCLVSDGSF